VQQVAIRQEVLLDLLPNMSVQHTARAIRLLLFHKLRCFNRFLHFGTASLSCLLLTSALYETYD